MKKIYFFLLLLVMFSFCLSFIVSAETIGPGITENYLYTSDGLEIYATSFNASFLLDNITNANGSSNELYISFACPQYIYNCIPSDYEMIICIDNNWDYATDWDIWQFSNNELTISSICYEISDSSRISAISIKGILPTHSSYYNLGEISESSKQIYINQGIQQEANTMHNVVSNLNGILDIQIAPNITIGTLTLIMLGVGVVGFLIKVAIK